MPWVTVKGIQYYRRSHRVNGRVVTTHVGRGAAGESIAALDALVRLVRQDKTKQSRQFAEPLLTAAHALHDADHILADVFAVVALRSGWYRHHRQWRRRRRSRTPIFHPEFPTVDTTHAWDGAATLAAHDLIRIPESDRAALAAAARGDPEALKVAMRYLEDSEYRSRWGDPLVAARMGLILTASNGNSVAALAMKEQAAAIARDLGWERAGSLERLAITRVVHGWLTVGPLESRVAALEPTDRSRVAVERCLTQAERRLAQAVQLLATLRRVSPIEILGTVGRSVEVDPDGPASADLEPGVASGTGTAPDIASAVPSGQRSGSTDADGADVPASVVISGSRAGIV